MAGLLLLVLARGLARGYRAAFRLTLVLLTIAGCGAILKGFDWEEAVVLGGLFVATWSQAALFDRPSHGDWIEGPDVVVAVTALTLFFLFGVVSHRVRHHDRPLDGTSATASRRRASCGPPARWRSPSPPARSICCCVHRCASRRPEEHEVREVLDLHAQHRRRHQPADDCDRRQVGVRRRRARLLPVPHHRSLRRRLLGSGRAIGVRAHRISRRVLRTSPENSIGGRCSTRSRSTGFPCCTIAATTSSSSARKRTCRSDPSPSTGTPASCIARFSGAASATA